MRVLVLMSTYNGNKYFKDQVKSILKQEGVAVDMLIRDDGSKDSFVKELKEYEKIENIEILYEQNIGCAWSFLKLVEYAYSKIGEYDYYAFSDQDDVWLPDKLKVACDVVAKMNNMKPCMYCSNVQAVDADLNPIGTRWGMQETFITKPQSLVCSMSHGCTMLFNKKVIELYHNYPPQQVNLHDLWIMHMCMFFGEIYYDNNPYILYRQHGNNVLGAKNTFSAKLKSRKMSIKHIEDQHSNEIEAKEMLRAYGDLLSKEDKEMIEVVANYRNSFVTRLKFLLGIGNCRNIRRKHDNFWLLTRIIIGKV